MEVSCRGNSDYASISYSFDIAPGYIKTYPTEFRFELMTSYKDQFTELIHWCHEVTL